MDASLDDRALFPPLAIAAPRLALLELVGWDGDGDLAGRWLVKRHQSKHPPVNKASQYGDDEQESQQAWHLERDPNSPLIMEGFADLDHPSGELASAPVVSPPTLWESWRDFRILRMSSVAAEGLGPVPMPDHGIVPMLGTRSIVLVGMMGAGKSSIGRRLATRLGIPFADADIEIEAAAQMTIPDIFATHGEPYFRAGEARVIARLLDSGPQVLATGGGAFMNEETRAAIRAKGISIWLKADLDVLMRRIKKRNDRPLLANDDPAATLNALIHARYPVYAEAELTVQSRDVPHEKILDEIIETLVAHLQPERPAEAGDHA